ncbi:MAG: prohibitin family protein [Anaerolineae bacterium]
MQGKKTGVLRNIGIALLVVVALVVLFSSYTIVDPGHRGVVIMLGRVEDTVLGEGFHLILPPVVRQVIQIDIRTKKIEIEAEAASMDLQLLQVRGILNYHVDPTAVNKLYQEVGSDYESIVIVPAMQESIKAATAQYRVENILVQRAEIRDKILEDLRERLARTHISVDAFSLADVAFSAEFDQAIEAKQVAEQQALQKEYELQSAEKEVEIQLARAEGEKQAAIIAAEGRAAARRIEAEAEAEALELIASELRNNEALIRYEWATRLSPSVTTILLPSEQAIILDGETILK